MFPFQISAAYPRPTESPERRIAGCVQQACYLEAAARKLGNVHPGAAFDDMTFADFSSSAAAFSETTSALTSQSASLSFANQISLGKMVLDSVAATCKITRANTNLGMILLISPLVLSVIELIKDVSSNQGKTTRWQDYLSALLDRLTPQDSSDVYEAIRLASPGGLGEAAEMDVRSTAPKCLLQAMGLAENRDRIAFQYTHDFHDLFAVIAPRIDELTNLGMPLEPAIRLVQVEILARWPDSLIARKLGIPAAEEAQRRAQQVLTSGLPGQLEFERKWVALDRWCREIGNRRNPGTTADLIAAGLFIHLVKREYTFIN